VEEAGVAGGGFAYPLHTSSSLLACETSSRGRIVLRSEGKSFGNSSSCSDSIILMRFRSFGAAKHAGQLPHACAC
jgi:hypothetical protein